MPTANARHILVDNQVLCEELIQKIKAGEDFAKLAKEHSSCPSGQRGGELGEFKKGMMVPEFDAVIFDTNNAVKEVYFQPVKTQFGFHVIEVLERED